MRITVNLASRPYVELRPVYQRLRLWMVILVLAGAVLGYLLQMDRQSAIAATTHVQTLDRHIEQLEQRRQGYRALMQQPENAATLRQSGFLNGLFKRKAFSWTATMEDLENVLPSGVEVQSLQPIVDPDGHVVIRLRVLGPRDLGIDLIRNLEHSKYFASPRLASESLASRGNGNQRIINANLPEYVNFDILADYRPLPHPAAPGETVKTPAKSTPEKHAPAVRHAHPAAKPSPDVRARKEHHG
jgi:type IV pilus assembly protein PilN